MSAEMDLYLAYVKKNAIWNESQVISTIKTIMNFYMGTPPEEFKYEGKSYSPKSFRDDYLKINADDYVNVMSTLEEDFHKNGTYNVPDNWWKCDQYYNLPLDEYMELLNKSLKAGYSVAIGGDVSEAGFSRETNVALIPDFDISSGDISDNARQFRFSNHSSTDDHIMHIIGFYQKKGVTWYLVKDSSSGSRNVEQTSNSFGYYFMHEDYIKLKILTFTVHKDMMK
jgi:bleomycin hydrolase